MLGKVISFIGGAILAGVAVFFVLQSTDKKQMDIASLNGTYKVTNAKLTSTITLKNGNFHQQTNKKQVYTGKVNLYSAEGKTYYILQSATSQNVFMYEYKKTAKGFEAKRIVQGGKVIETNQYVKVKK